MSLKRPSYFLRIVFFVDMNCSASRLSNASRGEEERGPYEGHLLRQRHFKRRVRKARDRLARRRQRSRAHRAERNGAHLVSVVHRHRHAPALEVVHVERRRRRAVRGRVHELQLPRARRDEVRRAVLVAERVPPDHDGVHPAWYRPRDALEDDRLAEDGAAEDVADLRAGASATGAGNEAGSALTVPFGLRHICLSLNSFTRASSGVIVAHLMPTLCSRIALAESTVIWSLVCPRGYQRGGRVDRGRGG